MHRFETSNPDRLQSKQGITGTVASLGLKRDNMGYAVGATEQSLLATVAKAKENGMPAHICQAMHALAEYYELAGKLSEAKMYYEQVVTAIDKAKLPPNASEELKIHYTMEKAGYYQNYAICLAKNNEFKASIERRSAVVQFMMEQFGRTSPYMRYPIEQLARGYEMVGDHQKVADLNKWKSQLTVPPATALPPRTGINSTSAANFTLPMNALAAAAMHDAANSQTSGGSGSGGERRTPLLGPDATRALAKAKQCASEGKLGQAYVMARTALQLAETQEKAQNCNYHYHYPNQYQFSRSLPIEPSLTHYVLFLCWLLVPTDVLAESICLVLGMICTHGGGGSDGGGSGGTDQTSRCVEGEQHLRRALQYHYRAGAGGADAKPKDSSESLLNAAGLNSLSAAAAMSTGATDSKSAASGGGSSGGGGSGGSGGSGSGSSSACSPLMPLSYVAAQRELGFNLMAQWRWNEALAFLLAAADTYARYQPQSVDRAQTVHHLGACYWRRGNPTEAVGALIQSLKLYEALYPVAPSAVLSKPPGSGPAPAPDHIAIGEVLLTLGGVLSTLGKWSDVDPVLSRAIAIQRKHNSLAVWDSLDLLSTALIRVGKYSQAEAMIKEQLTYLSVTHPSAVAAIPSAFLNTLSHESLPPAPQLAASGAAATSTGSASGGSGGSGGATAGSAVTAGASTSSVIAAAGGAGKLFSSCVDSNQVRYCALRVNLAKCAHLQRLAEQKKPLPDASALLFVSAIDAINDVKRVKSAAAVTAAAAASNLSLSPETAAADIQQMKAAASAGSGTSMDSSDNSEEPLSSSGFNPFASLISAAAPLRSCFLPTCNKRESKAGEWKRCGRCKTVCYCSPQCQTAHWPSHKPDCTAAPTTAHPTGTAVPTAAGGAGGGGATSFGKPKSGSGSAMALG